MSAISVGNVSRRELRGSNRRRRSIVAVLACLCATAGAQDLDYLRDLLASTPQGGWVKANTNKFSDAWVTGAAALPVGSYTNTKNVAEVWSSMAWDSTRGNLLLWGGGHAAYRGNEMYVWQGEAGTWTRGSLPSRTEQYAPAADPRTWLVVDDAAPQSSHTYEGNLYLPKNDMFLTFGGPVFQTGGRFQVRDTSGNLVEAGPWLWDPRKADANMVGGTTGSGYDPTSLGGEMWTNRQGKWTGLEGTTYGSFLNNSTAYREEDGHDVVYVTMKAGGNHPSLYRYTLGDVRAGELDRWDLIGTTRNALSNQSSGVIDNLNNLYVHTAAHPNTDFDLNVWDLSRSGERNYDIAIDLVIADGSTFETNIDFAIGYSELDGSLWLWDGRDRGTVYRTEAAFNADGTVASEWLVERVTSSTTTQPDGDFQSGVQGKWQFISELGVFVALDSFNDDTADAGVWLFNPMVTSVPEPSTQGMLLIGFGALVFLARSRRRRSDSIVCQGFALETAVARRE